MWKNTSLTVIIFFVTISCSTIKITNTPSFDITSETTMTPTPNINNGKTPLPPSLGAYFPQKLDTPNMYMEMLIKGVLTLDSGCLRVNEVDVHGISMMLIWDSRFSTRAEHGFIQVIDSYTGEILASTGDFVEVSGGSAGANPSEMGLKHPLPDECIGPYYLVGESIKKIDKP